MVIESSDCEALETFIAEVWAPIHIMSDNAKMETSKAWKSILRKYSISSSTTAPYHPHQNRCKRQIWQDWWTIQILQTTYGKNLYNIHQFYTIIHQDQFWRIRLQLKRHLVLRQISQHNFNIYSMKTIYYYAETTFPYSEELQGKFLCVPTNVGDALTYRVLTKITPSYNKVLCHRHYITST